MFTIVNREVSVLNHWRFFLSDITSKTHTRVRAHIYIMFVFECNVHQGILYVCNISPGDWHFHLWQDTDTTFWSKTEVPRNNTERTDTLMPKENTDNNNKDKDNGLNNSYIVYVKQYFQILLFTFTLVCPCVCSWVCVCARKQDQI